ncbi:MAG: hypothetical protein A2297_02850 [Elusimicrobia bacterium RIFOXYB2_FULL_48_7]|nr:MAG: hypothetical protein A2297_02850 [Elusimicrobia bacterium RIFOXYB2_FULL_48_7]
MNKGLIHVYTGDGKGKTTASVGLAVRARSHGMKVCFVSFSKEPERWGCGELNILKKIGINVQCFAKKHPHFYKNLPLNNLKTEYLKSLDCVKDIVAGRKYDLLVLDEINTAIMNGFISEDEILSFLKKKPKNLEVVLTGRGATKNIIKAADLVSEVKKIKHPYDKGVFARKGIEF